MDGMRAREHDWYAVLGVDRDATEGEIKAAHRRLARALHPDVNRESGAHERMSLVNRARDVLLDPERRGAFDRTGASTATVRARAPRPYTPAPPEPRDWYDFIGAEPGSSSSELIAALRRKRDWIRAQHFSDEDYTKQSLLWRDASETLTNPRSREAYDRPRRRSFESEAARSTPPDWYAFLGINRRAAVDDIADKVTELARAPVAGRQFKRDLDTAWRTLRDTESRAEYDRELAAAVAAARAAD